MRLRTLLAALLFAAAVVLTALICATSARADDAVRDGCHKLVARYTAGIVERFEAGEPMTGPLREVAEKGAESGRDMAPWINLVTAVYMLRPYMDADAVRAHLDPPRAALVAECVRLHHEFKATRRRA